MPKFHINNNGEAGACRATNGVCPFGGDAQHYSSFENARAAFELSMAAEAIPNPSRKKASAEDMYDPSDYQGFSYDEVCLDLDKFTKKSSPWLRGSEASKRLQMKELEKDHILKWEAMARTDPPKNWEDNVPVRLLPPGTIVKVSKNGRMQRALIKEPQILNNGTILGCYEFENGTQEYIHPQSLLDVTVVSTNHLSPRWERETQNAKALQTARESFSDRLF